jgi:aspartyl/asparaginyl beta-hydroxylase (cupin superfamily)/cytochrome c-type biogenesis protein CcmH/NrfG
MSHVPADASTRVHRLFDAAARAAATGRAHEAEQLVRQAELEAPRHPLVLNQIAQRRLQAGDFDGARGLLEEVVRGAPAHVDAWINLAAALRGLKRHDRELSALEKALALEPRNPRALFQAASLHELRGDARVAAATYRAALQALPPGFEPPPDLRPILAHAKALVDANEQALASFLESSLQSLRERHAEEPLRRFDQCFDTLVRRRPIYRPQPTFMYYPQLPSIEFYDRADFPWLDALEAATDDIRAELVNVLAESRAEFEPYVSFKVKPAKRWRELNNSRRWSVFFLWRAGVAVRENLARCPKTAAALEAWPRCDLVGTAPTAVFSVLEAKTRIPPHTGVNNARLIAHLPLIVPPGCGFRVGAEVREWVPGKAFVFDDTIEHEAWNDSDQLRVVLILDLWNPFLKPAEREMVSALSAGVGQFYGDLPSYITGGAV